MWGREKIVKTVEDIADHLLLVDHVKALQQGQKEIATALRMVNDRITAMEADFKVLKAEAQRDSLREVQDAINRVQGAFYDKLGAISTKLAIIEHDGAIAPHQGVNGPLISLHDANDGQNDRA